MAKFAQSFAVPTDSCFPYEAGIVLPDSMPVCAKGCVDPSQYYRAYDFRYVGGYFGNCSEVGAVFRTHGNGNEAFHLMACSRGGLDVNYGLLTVCCLMLLWCRWR